MELATAAVKNMYPRQNPVGPKAAFAGKPTPTEKQKPKQKTSASALHHSTQ